MAFGWLKKGFSTVAGVVSGGLTDMVPRIVDTVQGQLPEKLSEGEKAELELKIRMIAHQHEIDMLGKLNEQQALFNERIKELEGTASDLLQLPVLGHIMLFLRGAQRPIWSVIVLYLDLNVFSGNWKLVENSSMESAFWVINFLVLGFLFGERSIKNVLPLLAQFRMSSGGRNDED